MVDVEMPSIPSLNCDCGAKRQTIQHIVAECQKRVYNGDFADFLAVTDEKKCICNLEIFHILYVYRFVFIEI